jgi:hypothetical protein
MQHHKKVEVTLGRLLAAKHKSQPKDGNQPMHSIKLARLHIIKTPT